jgi:hypothetical protein
MSPIANVSPPSTALPTINNHTCGHKHGRRTDSADAPGGSVQNLFGSLLQTAEQVVGLQSGATSAAIATGTAASSAIAANAAAKNAGTISSHSAKTLLQNYMNNLSNQQRPNGLQTPAPAGTSINADA